MLHMRIYSNFVCLLLLLLVCAIRSLRIKKEIAATTAIVTAVFSTKQLFCYLG